MEVAVGGGDALALVVAARAAQAGVVDAFAAGAREADRAHTEGPCKVFEREGKLNKCFLCSDRTCAHKKSPTV